MKNLSSAELKMLRYNSMNVVEAESVNVFEYVKFVNGSAQSIPLNEFASHLFKLIKNKHSNINKPHDKVELEKLIHIFAKLFPKEFKTLNTYTSHFKFN